jgi:hypothetical protein
MTKAKPLPKPPRKLGPHGSALWASIHEQYRIIDAGGLATLALIAEEQDRAESCCAQIAKDGQVIEQNGILKEHPLLKRELAARAFVVRGLQRLGLDVEAVKPVGRPPLGVGWKGSRYDD